MNDQRYRKPLKNDCMAYFVAHRIHFETQIRITDERLSACSMDCFRLKWIGDEISEKLTQILCEKYIY